MLKGENMSEEITIENLKLRFTYKGAEPDTFAIIPRLRLDIDIQYIIPPGQTGHNIVLNFVRSELKIIPERKAPLYAGILIQDQPLYTIPPAISISPHFYMDLDYYRLSQIEKIREGGDLQFYIILSFIAEVQKPSPTKRSGTVRLKGRISKSDWVETFLPQLRYKDVSLIEIPKIDKPGFEDIVSRINEAWRHYFRGEYDRTLVECRKAIEGLTTLVRNLGFEREISDNEKRKVVPDWKKALGHKKIGEIIETLVQKHYGFLSPGAHYNKSINKEDAELAIMITHGLVNFISKKLPPY